MMTSTFASLALILVLLRTDAVSDAASTRSSLDSTRRFSPDCSTVIVSNSTRLPKSGGSKHSTTNCLARQGRKLPPIVGSLFREEVENYPEDEIKLILQQAPSHLKDLYNVMNTQLDPNVNLTERVAVGYYDEDNSVGEREESVCRTVTRNVYPREANLRNSKVYIPNNNDFMQVIQAELCHNPFEECNYLKDNLPYGMTSSCVQKYSYKKLLYMDPHDKRLSSDLFRYPSCCVCNVRSLPLDLRSNPANQSNAISRSTSYPSADPKTVTTPTTTKLFNMHSSAADVESPELISDRDLSSVTSPAPSNQPLEAAQNSGSSGSNPIGRTSKQLRLRSNQTVILGDDSVYNPKK